MDSGELAGGVPVMLKEKEIWRGGGDRADGGCDWNQERLGAILGLRAWAAGS